MRDFWGLNSPHLYSEPDSKPLDEASTASSPRPVWAWLLFSVWLMWRFMKEDVIPLVLLSIFFQWAIPGSVYPLPLPFGLILFDSIVSDLLPHSWTLGTAYQSCNSCKGWADIIFICKLRHVSEFFWHYSVLHTIYGNDNWYRLLLDAFLVLSVQY